MSSSKEKEKEASSSSSSSSSSCLIFQDVMKEMNNDAELACFELANVDMVGYRVPSSSKVIEVYQDIKNACGNHTGGIVWETTYLLLNYFLSQPEILSSWVCPRILEVGAGCGLLGQVLAAAAATPVAATPATATGATGLNTRTLVVLTECDPVMENLQSNLARNATHFAATATTAPPVVVAACTLDWLDCKQRRRKPQSSSSSSSSPNPPEHHLRPRSFDVIVGTDVVFSAALVKPLLKTLRRYLSESKPSAIYLCLQVRCQEAHDLFLRQAQKHGWEVRNMDYSKVPDCSWGGMMECQILQLTRRRREREERRKATTADSDKNSDNNNDKNSKGETNSTKRKASTWEQDEGERHRTAVPQKNLKKAKKARKSESQQNLKKAKR